jgi:hypothetical protein
MPGWGTGLTLIATEELEALLRALHHERLDFPLARRHLMAIGLSDLAERADILFGLDARGLRVVLVAVLAERRRTAETS